MNPDIFMVYGYKKMAALRMKFIARVTNMGDRIMIIFL